MMRKVLIAAWLLCSAADAYSQAMPPGFSCTKGHSVVEQMVCSDPILARMDRQLNEAYNDLAAQPGGDPKALRRTEDKWLREQRNVCTERDCIERAYQDRMEAMRQESAQQASPTASHQTAPFPIDPGTLRDARSHIGQSCTLRQDRHEPRLERFDIDTAMPLPVLLKNRAIVVRRRNNDRVAILLQIDTQGNCRISDVVALPPVSVHATLLFCSIGDLNSSGFGIRVRGQRHVAGYWDAGHTNRLIREPLGLLNAADSIRCSEPESGE